MLGFALIINPKHPTDASNQRLSQIAEPSFTKIVFYLKRRKSVQKTFMTPKKALHVQKDWETISWSRKATQYLL
jgi:hypothetical protein